MASAGKVTIIGAGSATFSLNVIRDFCITPALAGTTICLMDVDAERLDGIHLLAKRYAEEMQVDLRFEKTMDRTEALQDADFVINTAMTGGHLLDDAMIQIAEKHGYYRGSCPAGLWGSIRMPFVHGYHQLNLLMDVARSIEEICPDAWLIQSSNPVFEGCTLMGRQTGLKIIGLCHGHLGVRDVFKALNLDPAKVTWQVSGVNHVIYMTRFEYEGRNAYPLLDALIAEHGVNVPGLTPAAVNEYRLLGVIPIGDTIRRGRWIYHLSLAHKQQWYNADGGYDSEINWQRRLDNTETKVNKIFQMAHDKSIRVSEVYPPKHSGEQQVDIINALVNDVSGEFQVNIPNQGIMAGIADDVVVEIPVTIDKAGIHRQSVVPLSPKLMLTTLTPHITMMECLLQAYQQRDRNLLTLMALEDPRTHSWEQANAVLSEMFAHPLNSTAAAYFGFK
jgi:alpha-galactosidase